MESLAQSAFGSNVSGWILVGITITLVAICTFGLLWYYREDSVRWTYSIVIYISW